MLDGLLRSCFGAAPRDELALSFNGGKDSTVVLHLLRLAFHLEAEGEASAAMARMCTFFFPQANDFEEITTFVDETARAYGLTVTPFKMDFKAGLETLIRDRGIRAMVLGTRFGDPNAAGQAYFCPSSEGWPPFMRVNPVIDWSYSEVWRFLTLGSGSGSGGGLPYCRLYDAGYTSIGNTEDTVPNSHLANADGTFRPAHQLVQEDQERAGRVDKKKKESEKASG